MKHRALTAAASLVVASLVVLTSSCSPAANQSAPKAWASTEPTSPSTSKAPTKQERIDAAQNPRPRPPRPPQPSSRDLWRATVDSDWFSLGVERQAEICDSWRLLGNAKAHELLLVPDAISPFEVGERLEDELCLDHPG